MTQCRNGQQTSLQSSHLQVQCELGHHKLIQAYAFRFRFPGQRGVQRLGDAHVELAAVFPPLRAWRRFRQGVNELVDRPAFFILPKATRSLTSGTGGRAAGAIDGVVRFHPG